MPSLFPPNFEQTFRPEEGLPGMTPEDKRFTTNGYGFRGDDLRRVQSRSAYVLPDPAPLVLEPYARNLASLAGVAAGQGFRIAFLTQPTTWGEDAPAELEPWHWMTAFGPAKTRYDETSLDRAMRRYNETTVSVARTHGSQVLNLAERTPKSAAHFYDDVHFNEAGAAFAAREIARFLRTEGLVPAP